MVVVVVVVVVVVLVAEREKDNDMHNDAVNYARSYTYNAYSFVSDARRHLPWPPRPPSQPASSAPSSAGRRTSELRRPLSRGGRGKGPANSGNGL